jgi:integrase/recombinase XerD
MKVTLYTRERSTRKLTKVKNVKNATDYPAGTIYVLRFGATWETIPATGWTEAVTARLKKEIDIAQGWKPQPKPKRTVVPETPMLDMAIDEYLREIQQQRKPKTHSAYSTALRYFYDSCGNKPLQDIRRSDLLDFAVYLREEKGQSPRSTYNKFESVVSFLKRHDITGKTLKLSAHDWPMYTEEEPQIYEQETLDKFFAACDEDERLLFEFFMMTGFREQEVIYCTDRALNFDACTVSVRHNPKYNWSPKMYKERSVPVPATLMEKLKKMLVERGKGDLLFPTSSGKPKYNFLDICKAIARRAGIPEDEVWLHKFRATFATRSLWAGIDLRTTQSWMGHVDLASTMRYLKPNQRVDKNKVAAIWA